MLKVSTYKSEDSESVRNLILSILKEEYPFDMNAYSETDINDIMGVYSGERNAFFVIKDKNKVIGTAGVKSESGKTALLRRLFVEKSHRKQGLGATLVKKAINFCKSKGYEQIVFRATDRMKEAMQLLEKHGFKKAESLEVSGFNIHKYILKL